LPAGVVPPNPAELLSKKSGYAVSYLKTHMIILSLNSPVSLVADTLLIAKHADIYVMSRQLLEKRMLNIANNLYKEQNCQTCVCF
jgi:hypothetical protein